MLKKYQTDSHVIYGTLRLEIFIKYPLITRESRLFAEIRLTMNILVTSVFIFVIVFDILFPDKGFKIK